MQVTARAAAVFVMVLVMIRLPGQELLSIPLGPPPGGKRSKVDTPVAPEASALLDPPLRSLFTPRPSSRQIHPMPGPLFQSGHSGREHGVALQSSGRTNCTPSLVACPQP